VVISDYPGGISPSKTHSGPALSPPPEKSRLCKRIQTLDRSGGRVLDSQDKSPREIDEVQQPDVTGPLMGHFASELCRSFALQS
jgi:hypothetical protein